MEGSSKFINKSKSWINGKLLQSNGDSKSHNEKLLQNNRDSKSHKNNYKIFQTLKDYEKSIFHRKRFRDTSLDRNKLKCLHNKPLPQVSSEIRHTDTNPRFGTPVVRCTSLYFSNCIQCSINKQNPKRTLKDFEFMELLGTGEFSKVYLAKDRFHNTEVAIKVLNKANVKEDKLEHQVLREINIQSRLKHPNIIQLFTFFGDDKNIYLVLEYAAGGELYNILQNSPDKRFNNQTAAKYIYQVTDALQYCHENKVIHRDIKPENLILSSDGNVKLSDFGWSVFSPKSKRKTLCGTVDYIAPEMIEQKYYDERVDNWCVGVLCYEFLVGKPPFHCGSKEKQDTFNKIIAIDIKYPYFMCLRAKDLISKLVQKDPGKRLPLQSVKEHPWITYFLENKKNRNEIH